MAIQEENAIRAAAWPHVMRCVVTGPDNPYGQAITKALVDNGHTVRLFGGAPENATRWGENVAWHPGHPAVIGSIEPVLAEREVLIHAAPLDAAGRDAKAHAAMIEKSTIGAVYGAEREQVELFVHLRARGKEAGRFDAAHKKAAEAARGARGPMTVRIIDATTADAAATEVLAALAALQPLGKPHGRNDAITA